MLKVNVLIVFLHEIVSTQKNVELNVQISSLAQNQIFFTPSQVWFMLFSVLQYNLLGQPQFTVINICSLLLVLTASLSSLCNRYP